MAERLAGKRIVVVGAAGNLGPVWVEALLSEGAHVTGAGLGATGDEALGILSKRYGKFLHVFDLDITSQGGFDSRSNFGGRELAGIDGVVLNAGVDSVPGSGKKSLLDYRFIDWQEVFSVNVFGVVAALNHIIPSLTRGASVVTIGSMYGLVSPKAALYEHFNGGVGSMKNPAYGASKAALVAITKQYGTYLAPQGIRVNMLTLGGVAAAQDDEFVSKFIDHVPQGRMVPRAELPGALVFLMSEDSLSMTGHNLIVDGGYTSW